MARPHEEQKRTFSEDTAPQPEQVTMRTDCNALRGEAVKPHVWNTLGYCNRSLVGDLLFTGPDPHVPIWITSG
jgi:hypothetical protein